MAAKKDRGHLEKTYVLAGPKGKTEVWSAADFWKMALDKNHPKNRREMGYLVSQYSFDEDWKSWENHPDGDEIVICVSGKMTFIMQQKKGTKRVTLKPGGFVVVPKNTWHTAKVKEPSEGLFITWGFGTKHRPV